MSNGGWIVPILLVATLALAAWLGLIGFVLALGRVAARADTFAAARRRAPRVYKVRRGSVRTPAL